MRPLIKDRSIMNKKKIKKEVILNKLKIEAKLN